MKILACIAGLPIVVVDEILSRSPARFTEAKDNSPIVRPIKEPYQFRDGMADSYLAELAGRIAELNPRDEVAIVLAYVGYEHFATRAFVQRFFPFALHSPIPTFYPDNMPKIERRGAVVAYVDELERQIATLVQRARVVRDTLSGRNFTPLLLPLGNFQSEVLQPQIMALYNELGTAPNPREMLNQASAEILASHPIQLEEASEAKHKPKHFFEDDRRLRFKSPGNDRHGMARLVGEGHLSTCLINGRVRLGGPFDSQFHYDCNNRRGGVDRNYPNCHHADTAPSSAANVNIAPSDYVR